MVLGYDTHMVLKTLAVVRGGPSHEHDISLETGSAVLAEFRKSFGDAYRTVDIFIDRNGVWHVRGVPVSPEKALLGVDVVWNALHGQYGEDGVVQRVLSRIGIPYTGSGAYASALAMNKAFTKEMLQKVEMRVPQSVLLSVSPTLESEVLNAFRSLPQPSVIKPVFSGSSLGITIARSYEELIKGVRNAFQYSSRVMVEEYIEGREATVGVVEAIRGENEYVLPLIEIVSPHDFYDYEAKYNSERTLLQCPGNFSKSERDSLKEAARLAHRTLGLRHYSRSDFIVSPRGVFFLETNTLPGLTRHSNIPTALGAAGISMKEFVQHVVNLAIEGK